MAGTKHVMDDVLHFSLAAWAGRVAGEPIGRIPVFLSFVYDGLEERGKGACATGRGLPGGTGGIRHVSHIVEQQSGPVIIKLLFSSSTAASYKRQTSPCST